jgi:arylsulfate sulfotransferase
MKKLMPKICSLIVVGAVFTVFSHVAEGSYADDTTITITGHTAGVTPFISKLTLQVSNTTVLKSIQFAIDPKPVSVTRPLSGTYSNDYLVSRGFEHPPEIILPVYGLYAGYRNIVRLTYRFIDGSSKQGVTAITTAPFDDQGCGYNTPTKIIPRTNSTNLSYDYIFDRSACGTFSPVIIDSDGALRWVSPLPILNALFAASTFFDNAVYMTIGVRPQPVQLFRIELDGAIRVVADYSNLGARHFHHNIDPGKTGLLLEPDTTSFYESVILEVNHLNGAVIRTFNMAHIIRAAMVAGGDDPNQFVFPTPDDWFHENGVAYNRADDSLIVSSRENFVICIDYQTKGIKWILGDPTKKWYQFPSLRKFALAVAPGSLPPIGQHAPSITYDQNLLLFDNGQESLFQEPPGAHRDYASPRMYSIDLVNKVATEVWNFPLAQSIHCPFCSSIYEDAPRNYLIDYAFVNGGGPPTIPTFARFLGLDAAGAMTFYYQYPTRGCNTAYNSFPIHLENTKFPTVGPQALNLSTRGLVSSGDNVLIGGFIITGTDPKTMVLRALGPSLSRPGLNVLADPVLRVYNSSGALIATNDNWQSDPNHFIVKSNGLAPDNLLESATAMSLAPGAYNVIVRGKQATPGIGKVELYDLSPLSNSKLRKMSTRGFVGTLDNVLTSRFTIGDVGSATVIVRALGPSLAGVSQPLSDPLLTIYDSTGSAIATNDNWLVDNINWIDVRKNALSPTSEQESALVLHLPAGAYTAIARGANDGTGVGSVEVYTLP